MPSANENQGVGVSRRTAMWMIMKVKPPDHTERRLLAIYPAKGAKGKAGCKTGCQRAEYLYGRVRKKAFSRPWSLKRASLEERWERRGTEDLGQRPEGQSETLASCERERIQANCKDASGYRGTESRREQQGRAGFDRGENAAGYLLFELALSSRMNIDNTRLADHGAGS